MLRTTLLLSLFSLGAIACASASDAPEEESGQTSDAVVYSCRLENCPSTYPYKQPDGHMIEWISVLSGSCSTAVKMTKGMCEATPACTPGTTADLCSSRHPPRPSPSRTPSPSHGH